MASQNPHIELSSLPEEVRRKVLDVIAELMEQWAKEHKRPASPKKKIRPIGIMKGMIHMSDDFDAPLDDLKDYM